MESLPIITLKEVTCHDSISDCWVVIWDHVYNITDFVFQHPGGDITLLEHAGMDATTVFINSGHDISSLNKLKKYLIGILPESERLIKNSIFGNKNGNMYLQSVCAIKN